ncbi:CRISPR-associated protein, Cse2 family [Pseudogulbenkiania sp. NH8B]|uniref:type I-E CRISPR-associated protein Cse2/CasB n=1 Tax=Pseudogulbenkiania sp. (strain NH8B) TaxID=748280 RepID=UPI0002279715|nr:type I-E CRISPR-associated protein Cse2/CasB [Pseudogulbenkiania sp. NH8B]BAK75523.1 CRISPR-associated protein, Cse2 family [Pseudogulbenkiania sp. NH8B]
MSLFYLNEAQAETLRDWWQALDPDEKTPGKGFHVGRKDRAELRRAESLAVVRLHPAFVQLAARLAAYAGRDWQRRDTTVFALLAGLLPQVKEPSQDGRSWAHWAGQTEGERPVLSTLRFEQIQRCETEDELFQLLRRSLSLLGHRLDIVQLAEDLLAWVAEHRLHRAVDPRFTIRARWANDYYRALHHLATAPDAASQELQGESA